MTDMTIGKVADVVGVGVETIRFYERRKLIEQPPRPRDGAELSGLGAGGHGRHRHGHFY